MPYLLKKYQEDSLILLKNNSLHTSAFFALRANGQGDSNRIILQEA